MGCKTLWSTAISIKSHGKHLFVESVFWSLKSSLGAGFGKVSEAVRSGEIRTSAQAEEAGFIAEDVGGGWTRYSPP